MQRNTGYNERNAGDLHRARDLREDDDADHGRGRRQERDHERVRRPAQPCHGQLVEDVGDDGRRDADADAGGQCDGIEQHGCNCGAADRRHDHGGDEHRRREAIDARELAQARYAMGEHDVAGEEHGVQECEHDSEGLGDELHVDEPVDAYDSQPERCQVARGASADGRQHDHRQELDRRDRAERQAIDREVEAGVHHRQQRTERANGHPDRTSGPP